MIGDVAAARFRYDECFSSATMAQMGNDYYRILGVTRNARPEEIRRAFDRLRAQMREEAAPPDPRRVVLLQDAYDTLSDEARRAAYDQAERAGVPRMLNRRGMWIGIAVGIAVALGLATLPLRHADDGAPSRSDTEILSAASVAVGRVHAIDLSGRVTPLGLAFAVGQGRLLMPCAPIPPNSEIVVRIGARDVPARVGTASQGDGYCALDAPDAGSWPLAIAPSPPKVDAPVYATKVGPAGEVTLARGNVRRIERHGAGAVLELSGDAALEERGGPLLDAQGRVVAFSSGEGRFTTVSAAASSGVPRPKKGR
jgi:hypothetical protein